MRRRKDLKRTETWYRGDVSGNPGLKGSVICISLIMILLISGQAILAGQGKDGQTIYVERIITNPSAVLTDSQIDNIVKKYEGKYLSMDSLNQAVDEINKLYSQMGNYLAKAFLLSQEIEDGIVKIRLVESRLGEISIKNNLFTKDNYILREISLKKDDLIRLDRLQEDLFHFNSTNDVQIKAEIEPGGEYGTSDLTINTDEPPHVVTSIFADNAGRQETGLIRQGLSFTNNSVFGWRDRFSFSLIKAEGDLKRSYSYNLPVNRYGTRVGISYDESNTNIISGVFKTIGIKGEFKNYTLDLNSPFTVKPGLKRYGMVILNHKRSRNLFSGVELQASNVSSIVLGINSQISRKNNNIYSQHKLTRGYVETRNSQEEDAYFLKYNGDFLWQSLLEEKYQLDIKVQTQYTANKLLSSSDQYTLGGTTSVRGYPEGVLMGDSGFYLGTTLNIPLSKKVSGFIFYDHGGVFPYKGNNEAINSSDFLSSIGYGANISFTENLSGSVTIGVPIKTDEYSSRVDSILQVTF